VLGVLGWRAWRQPGLAPSLAVLVTMLLLYAPFSVDRRFLVPAVPLLLIAAATFLESGLAAAGWRRRASTLLVLALGIGGFVYAYAGARRDDAPEHRVAGAWLANWSKDQRLERPIVMSRKTWVAFYSGGRIAELPDGNADAVRARIAGNGTDVLIVDERWAVATRPALAPFLDPRNAPAGFVPLHEITAPKRLVIYDVRGLRPR